MGRLTAVLLATLVAATAASAGDFLRPTTALARGDLPLASTSYGAMRPIPAVRRATR